MEESTDENDSKVEDAESNSEANTGNSEEFNQILIAIEKYNKRIKRLEEVEVDFDNEVNSSFLELHKYRTKLINLYYRACEIKGISKDAGRPYLLDKNLQITGNRLIDRVINVCINEDCYYMPEYTDILDCIEYCNRRQSMGMDKIVVGSLADMAYVKVVESLQFMRKRDFYDNYAHIYATTDDPAKFSRSLWDQLVANDALGQRNLSRLIDDYVKRQYEEVVRHRAKKSTPKVQTKAILKRRSASKHLRKSTEVRVPLPKPQDHQSETSSEESADQIFKDAANSTPPLASIVQEDSSHSHEVSHHQQSPSHFTISTDMDHSGANIITSTRYDENINMRRGDYAGIENIDQIAEDSNSGSCKEKSLLSSESESSFTSESSDVEKKVKLKDKCFIM